MQKSGTPEDGQLGVYYVHQLSPINSYRQVTAVSKVYVYVI